MTPNGEGRVPGGYLGIALLASMITLAVMLLLFTDDPGGTMKIHVGEPLKQECDSSQAGVDVCYAVIVDNTSEDGSRGTVSCTVTNPKDGIATFENRTATYLSEPVAPEGNTIVQVQVDLVNDAKKTDPPTVGCRPT